MTTKTSFSDRKTYNHRFFNGRFFRFLLKTGWPLLVVFAIVFILSMVVPSVSYVMDELDTLSNNALHLQSISVRDDAVEFLYMLGVWNIVISMFGGLLCGLTAMRYTTNKVAVNFYHSLPMRREALFATSTLQTFLYYMIAYVTGLLAVFGIFAGNLPHFAVYFIRPAGLAVVYGVLFFFLAYSMTLLAASLTGTGFMRFIGAVYVVGLPVITYILFVISVGNMGIYRSILDADYYLSADFLVSLCAPLRLINLIGENADGALTLRGIFNKETIIVFLIALVFYGVAFLLYCIRPSESASKPVIWRPAAFVFKYMSMYIGATLFGLLFYGIMYESIGWMVFGVIIGSFIVFMLTNGILHKSARSIFKGIRGFWIFMAVMAVITVVFYIDVFGIFATVPTGSFVSHVEISVDDGDYVVYKDDFARKAAKLLENEKETKYGYYSDGIFVEEEPEKYYDGVTLVYSDIPKSEIPVEPESLYSGYAYDSMPVEAVFRSKLGIPFAVKIYPICEQVYELSRFIYDTGKMQTEVTPIEEMAGGQLSHGYLEMYLGNVGYLEDIKPVETDDYDNFRKYFKDYNFLELHAFAEKLSDPMGIVSDSPVVGTIRFYEEQNYESFGFDRLYYNYNRTYRNYLIHASDYEILNEIAGKEMFGSADDVIDYYIKMNNISGVYVVDNDTSDAIYITEPEKLREIVKSLHATATYYDTTAMCSKDHRYNVFVVCEKNQSYYDNLLFRRGAVPAFATDLLAGE